MADNFWKKLRFKFRVSIVNENTLGEVWHFRLSKMGVFFLLLFLSILSFALFALLIWLTPFKNYLPGYNENIREELIAETMRVDSLQNQLALQTEYLNIIRDVVAGEVESDSVQSLDSIALQQRTKLLESNSAITEEFLAQYEEKERNNLTLFDTYTPTSTTTLFRPIIGEVEQHYSPSSGSYDIAIGATSGAAVLSVLTGTIVYAGHSIEHEWEVIIQHESDYVSVYRNLGSINKRIGESVQMGEIIATLATDKPLLFQLWQKGNSINPEEVIIF